MSNAPADDSPFDEFIAQGAAATVYDPDGASNARPITLLYSNLRFVQMIGSARGNAVIALTRTADALGVASVIQTGARWYVVAKVAEDTLTPIDDPGIPVLLLRLPYQVTVIRASTAQTTARRNPWLELAEATSAETTGHIPGTAVTHQVRAGFSNSNDPISESDVGPTQNGLFTAYTPLLADIQLGDQVTLLDGRPAQVDILNTLYADGAAYALQPVLRINAGPGLTT